MLKLDVQKILSESLNNRYVKSAFGGPPQSGDSGVESTPFGNRPESLQNFFPAQNPDAGAPAQDNFSAGDPQDSQADQSGNFADARKLPVQLSESADQNGAADLQSASPPANRSFNLSGLPKKMPADLSSDSIVANGNIAGIQTRQASAGQVGSTDNNDDAQQTESYSPDRLPHELPHILNVPAAGQNAGLQIPAELAGQYGYYLNFTKQPDGPEVKQKFLNAQKGKYSVNESATLNAPPKQSAGSSYEFQRTGKLTLADGKELNYVAGSRQDLAPDEYRFKDADGQPFIADIKTDKIRREDLIQRPTEYGPADFENQPNEFLGNRKTSKIYRQKPTSSQVYRDSLFAAYGDNALRALAAYKNLTGEDLITPVDPRITQADIDAYWNPQTGVYDNISGPLTKRVKEIVEAYGSGREQGIKQYLGEEREREAQARWEIRQSKRDLLAAAQKVQEEALREHVIESLRDDKRHLMNFTTPQPQWKDGKLAVDDSVPEPSGKEVQEEMTNLTAAQLSPEQAEEAADLSRSDERAGLPGVGAGAFGDAAAGWLLNKTAAVARPFASVLGGKAREFYQGTRRLGNLYDLAGRPSDPENETSGQKAARFLGRNTADLLGIAIETGVARKIPMLKGREAMAVFAFDAASNALGKGALPGEVVKEGVKGAIQGRILESSSQASEYVLGKAFPNPMDEFVPKGYGLLTPLQIAALRRGAAMQKEAMRDSWLRTQLIGTGTEIATVGAGTYANGRLFGETNEKSLDEAGAMVFHRLGEKYGHAFSKWLNGKIIKIWNGGKSANYSLDLDGRVRRYDDAKVPPEFVDGEIIVDPENPVYKQNDAKQLPGIKPPENDSAGRRAPQNRGRLLTDGSAAGNAPQVFLTPPEKQLPAAPGAGEKFFKRPEESSPPPKELAERNPLRIETPSAAAVRRVGDSVRAQKIGGFLSDGKTQSVESLAKATGYSPEDIMLTLEDLYGARLIEILPDNTVRIIQTSPPQNSGLPDLYDKLKNKSEEPPPRNN